MTGNDKGKAGAVQLEQAIRDYLLWMVDKGYSPHTWALHDRFLNYFSAFIAGRSMAWERIFTVETLATFEVEYKLTHMAVAVRGLARYLYVQQRIPRPLIKQPRKLPGIYEEYLTYFAKTKPADRRHKLLGIRRVLAALHDFLAGREIELAAVRIEHLDAVLAKHNVGLAPSTCQINRSRMRGFLRYLYQVHEVLTKDLAALVVGTPQYAEDKPPKFLRRHEVRQLFDSGAPATAGELRSNAMLYLAFSLGLRPKEISLISLDDISFASGEISLPDRKCQNPIKLPLPEATIKAVAAYIIGARPQTTKRYLFLGLRAPYNHVSAARVGHDIKTRMHAAGLSASAYWLRHTYAQNLLETNTSIFEIKEMLGHDRIQTTRHYLHIHIRLMREVLFDETL